MVDYPLESLWIISDVDTMMINCVNHLSCLFQDAM
nr:MAG TPA: hypothetical protein [Caudoviricetes sp.]